MRVLNRMISAIALGLASTAMSDAALAQDDERETASAFDVSANVTLTSDYRFRGISLSDKEPAIQGGVDIGHDSGFFVGSWASSIAKYGGSNVEVDIYGGYGGSVAGVDYAVTALAYVYPGGSGVDYFETMGSLGTSVGSASVGLDLAWVPKQRNFGGDNIYLSGKAELPVADTNVSIFGHFGYENGDVYDNKLDWEAGASYSFGSLVASLSYVDTNYQGVAQAGRLAKAGAMASLTANF